MSNAVYDNEMVNNRGLGLRSVVPRRIKCYRSNVPGEVMCMADRAKPMFTGLAHGPLHAPTVATSRDGRVTVYQRQSPFNPLQGTSAWNFTYGIHERGVWGPSAQVDFQKGEYGAPGFLAS